MLIFHLKYVQMCPGHKFFQNVNISVEICVNVFQLIQHVNISLEICANVFGSPMDPYKDLKHVNISFEICLNVFQRAVHGSL